MNGKVSIYIDLGNEKRERARVEREEGGWEEEDNARVLGWFIQQGKDPFHFVCLNSFSVAEGNQYISSKHVFWLG